MRLTLLALLAVVIVGSLPAGLGATVSVEYDGVDAFQVTSDADDAILLTCDRELLTSHIVVNGIPSDASCEASVTVLGGPGPNRIDLGGLELLSGSYRGLVGFVHVEAGPGDDEVITPRTAYIGTTVDGGPGSDRIEGGSLETYVFGPAQEGDEVDTIVESASDACVPTWPALNVQGTTYWLVSWDRLDLSGIDGGAHVDAAAPGGILATMPGRTVVLERSGDGSVTIEAAYGGPGPDVLEGLCYAVGRPGDDVLTASPDGAALLGGPGADVLLGAAGPDLLIGGRGDDRLDGGDGADSLAGLRGSDVLAGGPGDDAYLFEATDEIGRDHVSERPDEGRDVLSFDLPPAIPVEVDLRAPRGVLARFGRVEVSAGLGRLDVEGAIGGAGDDVLRGSLRANDLWGGGGDDVMRGGAGDDTYWVDPQPPLPREALGYQVDGASDVPYVLRREGGPIGRCGKDDERCRGSYPATVVLSEADDGGTDTVALAQAYFSVSVPTRLDLSARNRLVDSERLVVRVSHPGGSAFLENAIGTKAEDVLIGNAADNVLEGLWGTDVLAGGPGADTCVLVPRRLVPPWEPPPRDRLRSCERRTESNPYRPPLAPFTQ